MKKKIIIVSASIVVLALIVGMGIYAQGGSKSSTCTATEQTDKNIPDGCKKCPEAATCLGEANQVDTTASACKAKCAEMKAKCGETKACCDKAKCEKCANKETCTKATACTKECPHKTAATGCEKKDDAQGCTKSSECTRECKKK